MENIKIIPNQKIIKSLITVILGSIILTISAKIKTFNNQVIELNKNLDILNPLSILDRGYAIVTNEKGKAIKSSSEVIIGESLNARLSDGYLEVDVKNKSE